ncbi:unnamed protein product [Prorocentrum cordatum]|uniref:Uncharacterized protein n=1 Tax=Prorocentrum cordatum TaxID=2364126 RepID=A0ABN9UE07_9DINO|nr:unnamed protein product [Polarella glacialis]
MGGVNDGRLPVDPGARGCYCCCPLLGSARAPGAGGAIFAEGDAQAMASSMATPSPPLQSAPPVPSRCLAVVPPDIAALAGHWVGLEGESVAWVEGNSVIWPDASRSALEPAEGGGFRVCFGGATLHARAASSGRLEWDDGDLWLRGAPQRGPSPAPPAAAALGQPPSERGAPGGLGGGSAARWLLDGLLAQASALRCDRERLRADLERVEAQLSQVEDAIAAERAGVLCRAGALRRSSLGVDLEASSEALPPAPAPAGSDEVSAEALREALREQCGLQRDVFAPAFDHRYSGSSCSMSRRGEEPYIVPGSGWQKLGLMVDGKYKDGEWLDKCKWPVVYHGTSASPGVVFGIHRQRLQD